VGLIGDTLVSTSHVSNHWNEGILELVFYNASMGGEHRLESINNSFPVVEIGSLLPELK
jgi:hypothetical protein